MSEFARIRSFGLTMATLAVAGTSIALSAGSVSAAPSTPAPVVATDVSTTTLTGVTQMKNAGAQLTAKFKNGESWHTDANRGEYQNFGVSGPTR